MLSEPTNAARDAGQDAGSMAAVLEPRKNFGEIAPRVFRRLQEAMAKLADAAPGPVRRAVDLQKALNVDAPLAWRVFKIATAEEPLEVVDYVLTPGQVQTLMEAAKKKRVPAAVIGEVRGAMEAYTELLHEHAGSRELLQMMVSTLRPSKGELIDEKCRRAAFQQQCLIWGQQSEVFAGCFIVHQEPDGQIQNAAIIGHTGFHSVRPVLKHLTLRARIVANEDQPNEDDRAVAEGGFLREFCSPDLETEILTDADHYQVARIKLPGIGRCAAMNFSQLFVSTREKHEGDALDEGVRLNGIVTMPSTMAHQDILVPAEESPRAVVGRVYGHADNPQRALDIRPADLLPVETSTSYLGAATDVPAAPGVPYYAEMVRSVLKRQGWYGKKFDVYRCRLSYPIMHTVVSLQVLPAGSGE